MHQNLTAAPAFAAKSKLPLYYEQINAILRTLRGKATYATMAAHLNSQGFRTPLDLPWTKVNLSGYLRRAGGAV